MEFLFYVDALQIDFWNEERNKRLILASIKRKSGDWISRRFIFD